MQMIVLTNLFDLEVPENAYQIMQMILKLCSVDFINTDSLFDVFNFRETEVF